MRVRTTAVPVFHRHLGGSCHSALLLTRKSPRKHHAPTPGARCRHRCRAARLIPMIHQNHCNTPPGAKHFAPTLRRVSRLCRNVHTSRSPLCSQTTPSVRQGCCSTANNIDPETSVFIFDARRVRAIRALTCMHVDEVGMSEVGSRISATKMFPFE